MRLLLALLLVGAAGCSASLEEFASRQPLGDGVRGRRWTDAQYLELLPDSPATDAATGLTHLGYDLAVSGSSAWMAASLYDGSVPPGMYTGYVRRWSEAEGWGGQGVDFQSITDPSVADVGAAAITADSGGGLLVAFLEQAGTHALLSRFLDAWDPASVDDFATGGNFFVDPTQDHSRAPFVGMAFDQVGRAMVSTVDAFAPGGSVLEVAEWSLPTGLYTGLEPGQLPTPATDFLSNPLRAVAAAFDGARLQCTIYQNDGDGILPGCAIGERCVWSACVDSITDQVSGPESLTPTATGYGTTGDGFAIAGDGKGTLLAVFYREYGGRMQLVARSVASDDDGNAAWSAPLVLSAGMSDSYQALSGVDPGVAYLGSDEDAVEHWLAVWPVIDAVAQTASILYATFDSVDGWSEPASLVAPEAYVARPHVSSLHLFSNTSDNAGIAVNWISSEGDLAEDDVHQTLVSRFHWKNGWLSRELKGNGCSPSNSSFGASLAGCTHKPRGALLPSGAAVVVFEDMDTDGRYRLRGVAFEKD